MGRRYGGRVHFSEKPVTRTSWKLLMYAFTVDDVEKREATSDLRGLPLHAAAKLYQEFDLLHAEGLVLSLKYTFDAASEQQGAASFRCEYGAARWTLQHSQSSFLRADSYRVLRDNKIVATFLGRWAFLPAELTLADGASFTCIRGFYQTTVRSVDGSKIAGAKLSWTGSLLGHSAIQVERTAEPGWVIPLLLILLHLTTYQSN